MHHLFATDIIHTEDRKLFELPGLWNLLVSELRESVICRNEKIVTADVRAVVIRWPMRNDILCKFPPFQLLSVRKRLPGLDSPAMEIEVFQLFTGSGKFAIRLRAEITGAVLVIEGDIADR